MRPDIFIGYIDYPGKLDSGSVALFSDIIREYPFCQPAQLLYLKSLQNTENIRFNRQLKIAAAYATDRKILFELLNVPTFREPEMELTLAEDPPRVTFDSKPAPDPDVAVEEYEKSGLIRQVEDFVPISEMDLLLFDFPAYSEDGLPDMPSQKRAPDFVSAGNSGGMDDPDLLKQFLATDPLSQRKKQAPVLRPIPMTDEKHMTNTGFSRKSPEDDLINRFIEDSRPKILRPDQAPLHDQDVSLNSLAEDDEFLTETLARIYVQQGYLLKAIQAYEKLSLKIPEKSVYFASQIDMVRELIKNQ